MVHVLLEGFEAYYNYFCEKLFENQMVKPLECDDAFLKSYGQIWLAILTFKDTISRLDTLYCVLQNFVDHERLIKNLSNYIPPACLLMSSLLVY